MTEPVVVDAPSSPEAAALVEAGATPVMDIDVAALLRRMQAMEDEMTAMRTARGMPADPIAAGIQDLRDHVQARANAVPARKDEFADVLSALTAMPDAPQSKETDYLRTVLDDMLPFEGLDYIKKLANSLHKLVLAV